MIALKARHERFCRRFVELAVAAGAAGYSPKGANVAGYRLLGRPGVARRIAETGAETARLHSLGGEVLVGKLENVYRRAIVDHPFHAGGRRRQRRLAPFVNFCNGGKSLDFNEVSETGVYFCISGRKGHSREIRGLAPKAANFCILLCTQDDWLRRVLFRINGLGATVA